VSIVWRTRALSVLEIMTMAEITRCIYGGLLVQMRNGANTVPTLPSAVTAQTQSNPALASSPPLGPTSTPYSTSKWQNVFMT